MNRRVMITPDDGLQPVLDAIAQAKSRIDVKMFAFTEEQLEQALLDATDRGVQVRVMLNPARATGERDNAPIRERLVDGPIQVRDTNPRFSVTHEKTMVIDGEEAWICSYNWNHKSFVVGRDFAVITRVPGEVARVALCFECDWERTELPEDHETPVVYCPDGARERFLEFIRSAKKSLWLQQEKLVDLPILEEIVRRHERGVRVKVMGLHARSLHLAYALEGAAGLRLLQAVGIPVRELAELHLHGKIIIADRERILTGSTNLYPTAFNERRECSIICDDPAVVTRLCESFRNDWKTGKPMNLTRRGIQKELQKAREREARRGPEVP